MRRVDSEASLAEGAESFQAHLAFSRGLAPKTLEAYGRDIRFFLKFLAAQGVVACAAVTRDHVRAYLDHLRARRQRPASRARAFVAMREFLAHLKAAGLAPRDVSAGLDAPRRDRALPKVLSEEVTQRLVNSVAGETPRDLRDRAMLEMLYGPEHAALRIERFKKDYEDLCHA